MKILLINPPDSLSDSLGAGIEFIQKYEPLGLLYIAALLKQHGFEVTVRDAYAEGLNLDSLKKHIIKTEPDLIGITTLTCQGEAVFHLGRWIKQSAPRTPVVLGNVHASVFSKEYLENGACDIVVHGDGEYPMLDIAMNKDLESVNNISFFDKKQRKITRTKPGLHKNLSGLPLPARDMLTQKLYNLSPISNQTHVCGRNSIAKTIITSRGCPFRCKFCCVHSNLSPHYNDPDAVIEEMELLEKKYNADYIFIMDSLFAGNTERLIKICEKAIQKKLQIKWGCPMHTRYITPEAIKHMEKAGCTDISLGLETGVQRLLDSVNKKITLEESRNAVKTIKEYSSIKTEGLFILGLPGERYGDALKTIDFANSLALDMAQFSIFTPYPGSEIFYELRDQGNLETGVTPTGLDPSVWNRYIAYICFTDIEPVWVTPGLNSAILRKLQKKALRKFYLKPKMIIKHAKRINLENHRKLFHIIRKTFSN